MRPAVLLLAALAVALPARSEVTDKAANGYFPGGLDTIAPAVDMVLTQQAQRLKAHAEKAARIP